MLRVPDGMRDHIAQVAKANNRSMNSEIVARLQDDFDPAENLPLGTRQEIEHKAKQLGVTFDEALTLVVTAGLNKDAPSILYIKAKSGMTLNEMHALFEVAKEKCESSEATIILEPD